MNSKTIIVKMDGYAWIAHFDDFINLQESVAGFGDTPELAISSLRIEFYNGNKN